MAWPTAWALSLPTAAPLRLRHSYPGPVCTARRPDAVRPATTGATRLLSHAVNRSANWQETTGSAGRRISAPILPCVVNDLRRTGDSITHDALAAAGGAGISNCTLAARRRAKQDSSSCVASSFWLDCFWSPFGVAAAGGGGVSDVTGRGRGSGTGGGTGTGRRATDTGRRRDAASRGAMIGPATNSTAMIAARHPKPRFAV
jgi:hypothetical protein